MKASPASRIQSNLQELFQSHISSGTAYVRLKLTRKMDALLPMSRIEESHVIAVDKVTPLPAMPPCVIGMMNSRDHVFCVFDLAQLLTLRNSMIAPQAYQILVVNTSDLNVENDKKILVGLLVSQIYGITRLSDTQIQQSIDSKANINSYIRGYIQEDQKRTVILDSSAIISRITNLRDQRTF